MFILGLLGSLITGGFSLAGDYIKGKNEKKKLELENEKLAEEAKAELIKASAQAKAEAMKTRMEGDVAWENIWAAGAQGSWKDEFWTLVLAYPYLLNLVPPTIAMWHDPMNAATYVENAFTAMSTIPEYWHWATSVGIGAAFGFRKVTDFFATKKGIK